MDDTDAARRAAVAARAAADAGTLADAYVDATVETKTGPTDYVTEADHAAQDRVLSVLRDGYPDDPVVGEEDGEDPRLRESVPANGPAWIVDPIDGTANYVRGMPTWACAVACVVDGDPVAAAVVEPDLNRRYVAGAGTTRRDGVTIATSELTDPRHGAVVPFYWWPHDARDAYSAGLDAAVRRFDDIHRLGCAQATLCSVADGAGGDVHRPSGGFLGRRRGRPSHPSCRRAGDGYRGRTLDCRGRGTRRLERRAGGPRCTRRLRSRGPHGRRGVATARLERPRPQR